MDTQGNLAEKKNKKMERYYQGANRTLFSNKYISTNIYFQK